MNFNEFCVFNVLLIKLELELSISFGYKDNNIWLDNNFLSCNSLLGVLFLLVKNHEDENYIGTEN